MKGRCRPVLTRGLAGLAERRGVAWAGDSSPGASGPGVGAWRVPRCLPAGDSEDTFRLICLECSAQKP